MTDLSLTIEVKERLFQMLRNGAATSKGPLRAIVSFEVGNCYALGFGVPKDMDLFAHWIHTAADAGHEFAKKICTSYQRSHNRKETTSQAVSQSGQVSNAIATFHLSLEEESLPFLILEFSYITMIRRSAIRQRDLDRAFDFLHDAARAGNLEDIETHLQFQDINEPKRSCGSTPLMIALHAGQAAAADLLLRRGANINVTNRFGHCADYFLVFLPPECFGGIAEWLHRAYAPDFLSSRLQPKDLDWSQANQTYLPLGGTPLSLAVTFGHHDAARASLETFGHGYSINQISSALNLATALNQAAMCDLILTRAANSKGMLPNPFANVGVGYPAALAFYHGNQREVAASATIKVLLKHGFDINEHDPSGLTALCAAVAVNPYDIALPALLVSQGASLEPTPGGLSVVLYALTALRETHEEGCIPWLLAQGAPVEAEHNFHPLHYACMRNAYGGVKALLQHCRDIVNVTGIHGHTALHLVSSTDTLPLFRLLQEYGANISAIDKNGFTPLEGAIVAGSTEIVEHYVQEQLSVTNISCVPPRTALETLARSSKLEGSRVLKILLRHPDLQSRDIWQRTNDKGRTALWYAVAYFKDELVEEFLEAGSGIGNPFDPKSACYRLFRDMRRIQICSLRDPHQSRQYQRVLQLFTDRIKAQGLLEGHDAHGKSLLTSAVTYANVDAVKVLLDSGASPHNPDHGPSMPLYNACFSVWSLGRQEQSPYGWRSDWTEAWAPARNKALLASLELLLDAGADPNPHDAKMYSLPVCAVLAAWVLDDAACVRLLCDRGADPNGAAEHGVRPVHATLEPFALLKSVCRHDTDPRGPTVDLVRRVVRTLLDAGAVIVAYDMGWSKSAGLATALCQCSPVGLRAMLEEGVELFAALGTGQKAYRYAVHWMERAEALHREGDAATEHLTLDEWQRERRSHGLENLEVARQYDPAQKWTEVREKVEALMRGQTLGGVAKLERMWQKVSPAYPKLP